MHGLTPQAFYELELTSIGKFVKWTDERKELRDKEMAKMRGSARAKAGKR